MKKLITVLMCLQMIIAPVASAQLADMYRASADGDDKGTDFYAKQVLGLGTSVVGSNILVHCPLGSTQPSLYIFMAGSLTHIASELFGAKSLNDHHNRKAEDLKILEEKMKAGGDLQKATIDAMVSEEQQMIDFVKNRKKWMTAVTAIYTAAAAMALVEIWLAVPPPFGPGKPDGAGCSPNPLYNKAVVLGLKAAYSYGSSKTGSGTFASLGGMAFNTVLPMFTDKVTTYTQKAFSKAIPRAATFTAAGVLAYSIRKGLADKQKVLEDNLSKLKKLQAQFTNETHDEDGTEEGAVNRGDLKNSANTHSAQVAVTRLPTPQMRAKSCFSKGTAGLDYGPKSCVKPLTLGRPKFGADMEVPALQAFANQASDLAQMVANGDMAAAEVAAGGIANQAARMKEIKDAIEKKTNEMLKSQGKPTIDLKAAANKQLAGMMADYNKIAGTGASLASLGVDEAKLGEELAASEETAPEVVATAEEGAPVPEEGISLEGIGDFASTTAVEEGEPTLAQSLDDYEVNENDISKKSDVSLFTQLSNRYLLNYTKIFEKKKAGPQEKPE